MIKMLYIDLYVQLRAMSLYDYLFIVTFVKKFLIGGWGGGVVVIFNRMS